MDELDTSRVAYYQLDNNLAAIGGTRGGVGAGCASASIPKTMAWTGDYPSPAMTPNISFRAKTFVVCIQGKDSSRVYDVIDWGFDTDSSGNITTPPSPAVGGKDPPVATPAPAINPAFIGPPAPLRSDLDILQDALARWSGQPGNTNTMFWP